MQKNNRMDMMAYIDTSLNIAMGLILLALGFSRLSAIKNIWARISLRLTLCSVSALALFMTFRTATNQAFYSDEQLLICEWYVYDTVCEPHYLDVWVLAMIIICVGALIVHMAEKELQ